jgi:Rha family phage regulatory protein
MSHTVQNPSIEYTSLVSVSHHRVIATSASIARHFGKQHKNVLRSIETLLTELPDEHKLNFELMLLEVAIGSGATRKDPLYHITRDGFTLLAMGFTGKRALQFKLAYIDAFNSMEAALLKMSAPPQAVVDPLESLYAGRWVMSFQNGNIVLNPVPKNAVLMAPEEIPAFIGESLNVPKKLLPSIILACAYRLDELSK